MQFSNWELARALIPVIGGIWGTLVGFRYIGRGASNTIDATEWHRRYGRQLKYLGPFLIIFGIFRIGTSILSRPIDILSHPIDNELDWNIYSSADRAFFVEMPAAPTESTEEMTNSDIHWQNHKLKVTLPDRDAAFSVVFDDFPFDWDSPPDEELLDGIVSDIAEGIKGTVVRRKTLQLFGVPVREVRIDIPSGYIYECRVLIVGKRQYQIIAVSKRSEYESDVSKRFLNSFQLIRN